jgi:hypothetical protein
VAFVATSYDFPQDLVDAQHELDQVRAALQTLYQRQPWSAEPMEAWGTHENAWRKSSRPASPGWDPDDAAEIGRLRARERDLATLIVTHGYWDTLTATDVPAARDALRHHHEQPPGSAD